MAVCCMKVKFNVGDLVKRNWNGRHYYIIAVVDDHCEYLIDAKKDTKVSKCKVCELPQNLTLVESK